MGFIYNAMDEAKELIANNLRGDEASYREIWDIIDVWWEVQLHRHLHAAAYYLNPQFQYSERKSSNPEVKLGLHHGMERLIPDQTVRELVDLQLVLFRNMEEFFGLQAIKSIIVKRSPDNISERNRFKIVDIVGMRVFRDESYGGCFDLVGQVTNVKEGGYSFVEMVLNDIPSGSIEIKCKSIWSRSRV
ncbi:uncharacterized protein LOC114580340 [Dendrobium catenatum]|uniref:uncharacterized protein LOC114580340 n=1 Tax=Dendrobium catenatum TaxID=906689 RepID=UPI00109FDA45|nr:uncharacterized protein LOC114580340 [Dendrobium catenatum]